MLVADGIGIIIGIVMCKKIPERTVKLISAGVFVFFGLLGSYQIMRNNLTLNTDVIVLIMTILYALTAAGVVYLIKKNKTDTVKESDVSPYCKDVY